jgi:hypothetical protein
MTRETQQVLWIVAWGISSGLVVGIVAEAWRRRRMGIKTALLLTTLVAIALASFLGAARF